MNREVITAQAMTALKARIKAEMNRRNAHGSLVNYAAPAYDFTTNPVDGSPILQEHGDKISEPTFAIRNDKAYKDGIQNGLIPEDKFQKIDSEITYHASVSMVSAVNSCDANCSGLCVTTCSGTCTGSCVGSCVGSCTGGCYTTCTSCSGCSGCSGCGGCDGSCSGSCVRGCASSCWMECIYSAA